MLKRSLANRPPSRRVLHPNQGHDSAIRAGLPNTNLITYEAQLPAAGGRWQGFRRLRDDLSGRIDRRFALSNDPPTAIDHHVRPQAELRT